MDVGKSQRYGEKLAERRSPAMGKTVRALFDGRALWPETSIDVKPGTTVTVTVKPIDDRVKFKARGASFIETARSLNLDGPSDWSQRLEEYLYGEGADGK